MATQVFYPYRTGPERISLGLDSATPGVEKRNDGSLLALDEDIDEVELHISVTVPHELLHEVLAAPEHDEASVDTRLLYWSDESRKRCILPLPGDGTVHDATLVLRRDEWRGSVGMEAILLRTAANHHLPPEFASGRGARLAWSEPRSVLFDRSSQPLGDCFSSRWEPFSQSADPWRRTHRENLFALDTSEDPPVVWLNNDVPRAYEILQQSRGTWGPKARIRDATYYAIIHQVWSSLFASALAELAEVIFSQEGVTEAEDPLVVVGGWKESILRDWSSWLYPDLESEGALEALVSAAADGEGATGVMGRLPSAIQSRYRTISGFQGLVREGDLL